MRHSRHVHDLLKCSLASARDALADALEPGWSRVHYRAVRWWWGGEVFMRRIRLWLPEPLEWSRSSWSYSNATCLAWGNQRYWRHICADTYSESMYCKAILFLFFVNIKVWSFTLKRTHNLIMKWLNSSLYLLLKRKKKVLITLLFPPEHLRLCNTS